MSEVIIGTDNGFSGGLCAISASHGLIIDKIPMPIMNHVHIFEKTKITKKAGVKSKTRSTYIEKMIDGHAVNEWIYKVTDGKPCVIAIEECPEHAQQKSIMRSMAISYGILIGAIKSRIRDNRLVVVRSGNPHDSWQRAMLGKQAQGDTKIAAINKAKELWPDETWTESPRHKAHHMGMLDAALIASFARLKQL